MLMGWLVLSWVGWVGCIDCVGCAGATFGAVTTAVGAVVQAVSTRLT